MLPNCSTCTIFPDVIERICEVPRGPIVVASFAIPNCADNGLNKNYVNIIQACCQKLYLAIGTENGEVYIFDFRLKRLVKKIFAEPWVSTIENCRGLIWTSGVSRSLMCIRVKDNKKLFHINTDTKLTDYDSIVLS